MDKMYVGLLPVSPKLTGMMSNVFKLSEYHIKLVFTRFGEHFLHILVNFFCFDNWWSPSDRYNVNSEFVLFVSLGHDLVPYICCFMTLRSVVAIRLSWSSD